MNQLVFVENGQAVTNSLIVAEVFGKDHRRVLQDVRELECSQQFKEHHFVLSSYVSQNNKTLPMYQMDRDGLAFLVMGYTGKKAAEYKEAYIQEFNRLEEQLKNKIQVLDDRTALIQSMKLTVETVEKQDQMQKILNTHQSKINDLEAKVEEQITLTSGEQRRLQKAVASKVYELCDDPADRPKFFSEIYREIKNRFAVASYKDVKQKELQAAIRYIENWIPRKVS